jgi:hypothetical protein
MPDSTESIWTTSVRDNGRSSLAWPIRTAGYFNVIAKVIGPEPLGSSSEIGFRRTTAESLSPAA